jgi:hypothetical protein
MITVLTDCSSDNRLVPMLTVIESDKPFVELYHQSFKGSLASTLSFARQQVSADNEHNIMTRSFHLWKCSNSKVRDAASVHDPL